MDVMVDAPRAEGVSVRGAAPLMQGEEDIVRAFDALFAHYHSPIQRHLLRMVGDVEQAQDLTQDTFLKAYLALPRMRACVGPAWLYRIATNTALDALRHRRRLTWIPFTSGDEDRWTAPEDDVSARYAAQEAVHVAIACLTPAQRACLMLRARDGFSIDEIAHRLGLSDATVKTTLYRAKGRFRVAYAGAMDGDGRPAAGDHVGSRRS